MATKSPSIESSLSRCRDIGEVVESLNRSARRKEGRVRVLNGQVITFFADHTELGRSATTTNTTDAGGHTGFAYSMYSIPKSGQQKPFVIYIVEESGQKFVANILVNRFVEGRHQLIAQLATTISTTRQT